METIPTFQERSSDWEGQITFDNQEMVIRITWNDRVQFFFMTLTDPQGAKVSSIKIVPKNLLLRQRRGSIEFFGDIVCLQAEASAGKEITYENFGTEYQLNYLTAEEVDTFQLTLGV